MDMANNTSIKSNADVMKKSKTEKMSKINIVKGAAAAAVVAVAMWALSPSSVTTVKGFGEVIALTEAELDMNRMLLEMNGINKNFTVRDYSAIDGDMVDINGSAQINLNASPVPLAGDPGELELSAIAGSSGCVTVEIADEVSVYQLCLRDGDPIKTYIKE